MEAFDKQLSDHQAEQDSKQNEPDISYFKCSGCGDVWKLDGEIMVNIDSDKNEMREFYDANESPVPFVCDSCNDYEIENIDL